jgi:hypothetical protein
MSNERRYKQIKTLLATAGARFISIHFKKKDGSDRQMTFNPAAAPKRVKGENASEQAQRAAETRATNNPNLINVWDNAKQSFRSINMDTIYRIVIDGVTYDIS